MSNRDAIPLGIKAHSAFHDACIEEIRQGQIKYGLPCLLGLHTGLRRSMLTHYLDKWREEDAGGEKIVIPKQVPCTLDEGGCYYCKSERSGGPDGVCRPKTGQGQQRSIPIFETWMDHHLDKERQVELSKWLDHWFKRHDETKQGWGYKSNRLGQVVKLVASRRHDIIADEHQGEETFHFGGVKKVVPDIITHDLRATWTTQCIRTGVKESTVMDWGGWENPYMVVHYRGFVGDPQGTERDKYNTGRSGNSDDSNGDIDMQAALEVYQKITENEQVNPANYDNATLEAAYDMIDAS